MDIPSVLTSGNPKPTTGRHKPGDRAAATPRRP